MYIILSISTSFPVAVELLHLLHNKFPLM